MGYFCSECKEVIGCICALDGRKHNAGDLPSGILYMAIIFASFDVLFYLWQTKEEHPVVSL